MIFLVLQFLKSRTRRLSEKALMREHKKSSSDKSEELFDIFWRIFWS